TMRSRARRKTASAAANSRAAVAPSEPSTPTTIVSTGALIVVATHLGPRQAGPGRRPLSPEPLGRRKGPARVGWLPLDARAVARGELRLRVAHFRAQASTCHQEDAWLVAGPHEGVLRPGWRVEEVPGPEAHFLALDEQSALPGQNEERFLIRLGVIDA